MSALRILNSKGDEEVNWAVDDEAAQDAAKEKFMELVNRGHAMFKIENGDSEKIKSFDPNAAEIIAVAPLVGG